MSPLQTFAIASMIPGNFFVFFMTLIANKIFKKKRLCSPFMIRGVFDLQLQTLTLRNDHLRQVAW